SGCSAGRTCARARSTGTRRSSPWSQTAHTVLPSGTSRCHSSARPRPRRVAVQPPSAPTRVGVPPGEEGARLAQLGGGDVVDVGVEATERGGYCGPRPRADRHPAAAVVQRDHRAVADEGGDLLRREGEGGLPAAAPVAAADRTAEGPGEKGRDIPAGQWPRREGHARPHPW